MINTDNELIYADLTYQIRGALFTVYNTLGHGHKEEVYQKALSQEFTSLKIPYKREVHLKVMYKDEAVGTYRPDFLIDEKIILEIKAVEYMAKAFESQLLHYLKTTNIKLGLLINFGSTKLFIKRMIWTNNKSV